MEALNFLMADRFTAMHILYAVLFFVISFELIGREGASQLTHV